MPEFSKSILIIRSNSLAPDPRVEKIASALAEAGYSVRALGWDRTGDFLARENRDGYLIERILSKASNRHGLANLPQLLGWQVRLTGWLLKHHREFGAIHACDFDTLVPALLCKRLYHQQVVYDIFDFYADMLRATPSWLANLIRKADLKAIGAADAVILADKSRVEQIHGSHPKRLEVIYNSPPEGLVERKRAFTQAGKLRIAYIGNLQRERGLFELLTVMAKYPDWHLDLGGFGPEEAQVRQQAARIPNITWYGMVPYAEVLRISADADTLLATYSPAVPNNRYSSPNKVFEAMLLGRPIVVARGTNADRLVEEAQCGLVVEYGSIESLEQALWSLASNPAYREELGQNGRKTYEDTYSWACMSQRLKNLYTSLLKTGGDA